MNFIALFAETVLHFAILLPCMLLTSRRRGSRYLLLLLSVFYILLAEALITGGLDLSVFNHQRWNWIGKSACFLFMSALILRQKLLRKSEVGWTLHLLPRSAKPVLWISIGLLLIRLLIKIYLSAYHHPDAETLAFQFTLPGLSEEVVYRGLLLGLFNRLFTVKSRGGKAVFNWPLIWVSLLFGLAHGVKLTTNFHLKINLQSLCMTFGLGLILGWIRQKSGSLWPAILFHNLWNIIVLGW